MHGVAEIVAEHLHLDMARLLDIFLDQHRVVAEGGLGLAPRAGQRLGEIVGIVDAAHALAAAAGARLDQHRIADLARLAGEQHQPLVLAVIAGHHRHAGLLHQPLGGVLQSHGADRGRRRADEHQPGRGHLVDEAGVFRQEAVTGMDRLSAGRLGRGDDPVAAQIALADRRSADMHRLVGHLDMQRLRVGVRIDGDRRDAHPARRADDAAGDLAAVGDQDLGKHSSSTKKAAKMPSPPPYRPVMKAPSPALRHQPPSGSA